MAYIKPAFIAQNSNEGSYAAGCPCVGTDTCFHCSRDR